MYMNDERFLSVFKEVVAIANTFYDGHFTLLKFTKEWGFCFETLEADNYSTSYMAKGKTPEEAMEKGIRENINAFDIMEQVYEDTDFDYNEEEFDPKIYERQEPIRIESIGRNKPCPCGSGKKYKKCCGN